MSLSGCEPLRLIWMGGWCASPGLVHGCRIILDVRLGGDGCACAGAPQHPAHRYRRRRPTSRATHYLFFENFGALLGNSYKRTNIDVLPSRNYILGGAFILAPPLPFPCFSCLCILCQTEDLKVFHSSYEVLIFALPLLIQKVFQAYSLSNFLK